MTHLRNLFLQGIALLAPLIITVALVIWLGGGVELIVGDLLRRILPDDWYLPGLGLAVGILLTIVTGLVANIFLVRWLVGLAERIVDRIPLVKSLFQGLKDMAQLFSRNGDGSLGRPVSVELNGMRLVGFVMQEQARLPDDEPDSRQDQVAVFLPMSYQIGGYTLYMPRDRVKPLDVGTEQAMRAVLTGGSLMRPGKVTRDT
ncbi:DUF502 domain-containing protein [Thiorhodococcus mannitoliphagus]|uniref:DUF502 domain-containing protein n=1 Tax=Thiorhodococcus mannitoliphagus TaxID=329406 RepID=A0A6P1E8D9_9GAMM|nr:DUF502 domain-containing protein [Thiorhodococcus mannitoliphagus]NEX23735.1 DUF502 domain-containing protein [Thiorhodococcus mannitoliphagus]